MRIQPDGVTQAPVTEWRSYLPSSALGAPIFVLRADDEMHNRAVVEKQRSQIKRQPSEKRPSAAAQVPAAFSGPPTITTL